MTADSLDVEYQTFFLKFQRDLNRISDADRTTRKRGLQNILEQFLWTGKTSLQKKHISQFVNNSLMEVLLVAMTDSTEKCRETVLKIIEKIFQNNIIVGTSFQEKLVITLCGRIGDLPFIETSEELRLLVLQIISGVVKTEMYAQLLTSSSVYLNMILTTDSKALYDSFPAIKRLVAESVCEMAIKYPQVIQMSYKPVIMALVSNGLHQHSKTRIITLKALSMCVACIQKGEDYDGLLSDTILPLLSRILADSNPGTRKELCQFCQIVLISRYRGSSSSGSSSSSGGGSGSVTTEIMTDADRQLLSFLLILQGDESEVVLQAAATSFQTVADIWMIHNNSSNTSSNIHNNGSNNANNFISEPSSSSSSSSSVTKIGLEGMDIDDYGDSSTIYNNHKSSSSSSSFCMNSHIQDGELELRKQQQQQSEQQQSTFSNTTTAATASPTTSKITPILASESLLAAEIQGLANLFILGVNSWTMDSRLRYLRGLTVLISSSGFAMSPHLPSLLYCLSTGPLTDDESTIRNEAQRCCRVLGSSFPPQDILDLLLPRAQGVVSGSNTAAQRTSAILLLAQVLVGMAQPMEQMMKYYEASGLSADIMSGGNTNTGISSNNNSDGDDENENVDMNMAILSSSTTTTTTIVITTQHETYSRIIHSLTCSLLASSSLYEFPEIILRGAVLLLLRNILTYFPTYCCCCSSSSSLMNSKDLTATTVSKEKKNDDDDDDDLYIQIEKSFLLSTLFLQSKTSGTGSREGVLMEMAQSEMIHLAQLHDNNINIKTNTNKMSSDSSNSSSIDVKDDKEDGSSNKSNDKILVDKLIALHYCSLYTSITGRNSTTITSTTNTTGTSSSSSSLSPPQTSVPVGVAVMWSNDSAMKGAFEVLCRSAPRQAWKHYNDVLAIIIPQMQPKRQIDVASPEAQALSYASQRGEEIIPSLDSIDTRLSLLVLLESLLRSGTSDWECSSFISQASGAILQQIVIPNLIWRVGRVEATMRKITMAICYSILKAGSVTTETLFQCATGLLPLLISHLDDIDFSPRLMSCYCCSILFQRLKNHFSEQSIHEIYPKLLKRLDDSHDEVRLAICMTFQAFFQNSSKSYYQGTLIDYCLDQFFIHLDDPDMSIQNEIYQVIVSTKNIISQEKMLEKIEKNILTHRSPYQCEKLRNEIQGYEILS